MLYYNYSMFNCNSPRLLKNTGDKFLTCLLGWGWGTWYIPMCMFMNGSRVSCKTRFDVKLPKKGLFRNQIVCFGLFSNLQLEKVHFLCFFMFYSTFLSVFSFWNRSVCFGFSYEIRKTEITETNAKQILFRLFSVQTKIFACSFLG